MRALHDYAFFATEAAHRDVIIGHWIHVDPQRRRKPASASFGAASISA